MKNALFACFGILMLVFASLACANEPLDEYYGDEKFDTFAVKEGDHDAGVISDLWTSNDVRMDFSDDGTFGSIPISVDFVATWSENDGPISRIELTFEGYQNQANAYFEIRTFNYNTSAWDLVATIDPGTTESTHVITGILWDHDETPNPDEFEAKVRVEIKYSGPYTGSFEDYLDFMKLRWYRNDNQTPAPEVPVSLPELEMMCQVCS